MGVVSGSAGLGFGASFSLEDNFSDTAEKIQSKFGELEGATDKMATKVSAGISKMQVGLGQLGVAVAIAAPLALGISAAIEFESAFAGVKKTVELTDKEFSVLEGNIRSMAKTIPISTTELSNIAEIAGQLGVTGVEDITKFTKTVAMIQETTNLTGESAATDFARLANIMQIPLDQIDRMASSVVGLGNTFATNESEVLGFATRIAATGQLAKLTAADVFGISAAFSSVGITAEAGGTSVNTVLLKMNSAIANGGPMLKKFADAAGLSIAQFKDLSGAERFEKFVLGLGKQGVKADTTLKNLGLNSSQVKRAFLSLAGAGSLVSDAIKKSNEEFEKNKALQEEAAKRFATTASKIQVMKNKFNDMLITVGQALLPVVNVLIDAISGVVDIIGAFMDTGIGAFIIQVAGAIAVAVGVMGLFNLVVGASQVALAFLGATAGVVFSPIVIIIGIVIGAVMLVTKSIEAFKKVMSGGEVAGGFLGILQSIGGAVMGIVNTFRTWNGETFTMSNELKASLEKVGVLEFVLNISTLIVRLIEFTKGVARGVMNAFKPLGAVFNRLSKAFQPIISLLGKLFNGFGKVGGEISTFAIIGELLGGIIGTFIVAPLEVLIGILVVVIDFWVSFGRVVRDVFNILGDLFNGDAGFIETMGKLGSRIGNAFINGLKQVFSGVGNIFKGLVDGLLPSTGIGGTIKAALGIETETKSGELQPSADVSSNKVANINKKVAENKVATAQVNSPNVNVAAPNVTAVAGQTNVTLELDGDVLAKALVENESLTNSRE